MSCVVFLLAIAPWCKSSILGDIFEITPVPLEADLKHTTVVFEDSRESCVKRDGGERIFLAEAEYRQEKVKIYERRVESIAKEEITLKREIKQQRVLAKEQGEVSTWCSGDRQVEDTESVEEVEPAYTEYETENLEETESRDEEDFVSEDKALDQREEMSLRSVSPLVKEAGHSLKRDVAPSPEVTRPIKKEVSGLTSKKEVLAYKKTPQEKKLKDADIASAYPEQKEFPESFPSVHHEEIEEETVSTMEDLVTTKFSDMSKVIPLPKKPRVPKKVTLLKQADSEEEEVLSETSMHLRKTVPPPLEQDLTQILPKTTPSHPMTAVPAKKGNEIKIPKVAGKMDLEDTVPVSEEVSFEEELVPATSIPASRDVSHPVPARIPSPEKIVSLEEKFSPSTETVLPAKKTSPALSKAVAAPKEDFQTEEVTLPKKPISKDKVAPTKRSQVPRQKAHPPEEETLPSKKPAALAQKILTPEVCSSEEPRSTATKPPPTREVNKKTKKGTQEIEQETLEKGILFCLSRTGP